MRAIVCFKVVFELKNSASEQLCIADEQLLLIQPILNCGGIVCIGVVFEPK